MKILFEFLPIIVFFALFKMWGIYIATIGAIIITALHALFAWFKDRRVPPALLVGLVIIILFGGATLLLKDETFIKLKPTVLYFFFAGALVVADRMFGKNFMRIMMEKGMVLPEKVWRHVSDAWAVFFFVLAGANFYVASVYSTETWVNFKLFGILGALFVFAILQSLFLYQYIEKK